jgi:hypothetical protein
MTKEKTEIGIIVLLTSTPSWGEWPVSRPGNFTPEETTH